jgi:hypothetical protein
MNHRPIFRRAPAHLGSADGASPSKQAVIAQLTEWVAQTERIAIPRQQDAQHVYQLMILLRRPGCATALNLPADWEATYQRAADAYRSAANVAGQKLEAQRKELARLTQYRLAEPQPIDHLAPPSAEQLNAAINAAIGNLQLPAFGPALNIPADRVNFENGAVKRLSTGCTEPMAATSRPAAPTTSQLAPPPAPAPAPAPSQAAPVAEAIKQLEQWVRVTEARRMAQLGFARRVDSFRRLAVECKTLPSGWEAHYNAAQQAFERNAAEAAALLVRQTAERQRLMSGGPLNDLSPLRPAEGPGQAVLGITLPGFGPAANVQTTDVPAAQAIIRANCPAPAAAASPTPRAEDPPRLTLTTPAPTTSQYVAPQAPRAEDPPRLTLTDPRPAHQHHSDGANVSAAGRSQRDRAGHRRTARRGQEPACRKAVALGGGRPRRAVADEP